MKPDIHPDYVETVVTCSSCGSEAHTHGTVPVIRVDLCSNCHPFYTGKQRIVDTAGRVDKFNQRRAAAEKAAKDVKTAARKREKAKTPTPVA
jgi:large subunit ribosomal protein L31